MVLADEQYASGAGFQLGSSTANSTQGETLWTLGDHQGSIRDVIDNNGVVRQHLVYSAWGVRLQEFDRDASGNSIASNNSAAIDELFGYTGRDWDADANLQYNRARWYDPQMKRWLSQDPIGFAAGDWNLYRYVGSSPTNATDPFGLQEADPSEFEKLLRALLAKLSLDKLVDKDKKTLQIHPVPMENVGFRSIGFTCSDYALTAQRYLKTRLPKETEFEYLLWRNDASASKFYHAVVRIKNGDEYFILDPRTNTLKGPYATEEESEKAVLEGAFKPFYKNGIDRKLTKSPTQYSSNAPWFLDSKTKKEVPNTMRECEIDSDVIKDSIPSTYELPNGKILRHQDFCFPH